MSSLVHFSLVCVGTKCSFVEFPRLFLVSNCLREAGAGGSNPLTPTIKFPSFWGSSASPRIRCLVPSSLWHKSGTGRHYGYHQKEGHRYHVQIRRRGQSITRTLDRLATAKSWIPKIEGDIERHLYVESSRLEKTTLLELLERYERQILPTHKGQQVKAYRLETLHYNCKPFYLVNNTWRQ